MGADPILSAATESTRKAPTEPSFSHAKRKLASNRTLWCLFRAMLFLPSSIFALRSWRWLNLVSLVGCSHHFSAHQSYAARKTCEHQRQTSERQLADLDGQAALLSAQEALRLCPDDNDSLIIMGRALAAADRLEEACRILERARMQGSRARHLFFILVNSYDVLGDQERAAMAASDFLEDHPDDFPMRSNYANALLRSNRAEEAVGEFDRIRHAHPDDVAVLDALAQAFYAANRFEEARQTVDRAMTLEEDRIESRLLCARTLIALGQQQQARAILKTLLLQHPKLEEGLKLRRQLDEASL